MDTGRPSRRHIATPGGGRGILRRLWPWEALSEAETRFRTAFDHAAIGMALLDLDGRFLEVNRALCDIVGHSEQQLVGTSFTQITHPDDVQPGLDALRRLVAGEIRAHHTEKRCRHADGHWVWVLLSVSLVERRDGSPGHFISQVQDITKRKAAEAELARQASHDPLTGLPNRALFLDRVEVALARQDRRPWALAVLFLDLDRFKVVNDSLGHAAGDLVLVQAGMRLRRLVRPSDTVSRFGGDEFTILCEDIVDERDAIQVAERVAQALRIPFRANGQEVHLTASIGISSSGPDSAHTAGSLLRDADAAMYRAKERGRARHELFEAPIREHAVSRLRIESALRTALRQGEIEVFYQPQRSLLTGALTGVEALARWREPEQGLVLPAEFISVAEESGLIAPLGERVLLEACTQAQRWRREYPGLAPLTIAVNLSAGQLAQADFPATLAETIAVSGIEPSMLCLEITESALVEEADATLATLAAVKRMGVGLAIDDFGVGFSSLGHIRRLLPVDVLKIDRSFIDGLGRSRADDAIVASMIGLARSLGIMAIAEGVETAGQAQALRELGCEQAQGFYFGRPAPARETGALLDNAPAGPLLNPSPGG